MASKYLKDYPVPSEFPHILRDLTRQILRLQPQDIIQFSAYYFKCKNEVNSKQNLKFEWNQENPRAPRPCDYPGVKRDEPMKIITTHSHLPDFQPPAQKETASVDMPKQTSEGATSQPTEEQRGPSREKMEIGALSGEIFERKPQEQKAPQQTKVEDSHSEQEIGTLQGVETKKQEETPGQEISSTGEIQGGQRKEETKDEENKEPEPIKLPEGISEVEVPSLNSPSEEAAGQYVESLVEQVEVIRNTPEP